MKVQTVVFRLLIPVLGVLALPWAARATQEATPPGDVGSSATHKYVPFTEKLGPRRVFPAPARAVSPALGGTRTNTDDHGRARMDAVTRQPRGAMSGKIVYTSAGHGWTAYTTTTGVWYTQRGDNNELVEDVGNADQLAMFAAYCFNAGATVVPFRPIGDQVHEVVLDNDDAGVEFSGPWSDSASAIYYGDPGDAVPYRFAVASSSGELPAVARYTPNIPAAGFYPIYTWARAGANRVDDQLYRIGHTGGVSEVRINHRRVGNGWIYLGTYYLDQGTSGCVEISNDSSDVSTPTLGVIADAIRFGNGMGDIDRGLGVSGKPRQDEASRYWVQRGIGQGQSSAIYDRSDLNDESDNVGSPPRMAAAMNVETEGPMADRVFLSFHTNASDPGSLGLYNGNNYPESTTPNQKRLAEIVAGESNDDLSAIGSPPLEYPWPNRRTLGRSLTLDRTDIEFGEINSIYSGGEFDATILEVAAHDTLTEARDLLDPKCRNWVARACCQALVRYFNEFGDAPLAFLPDPPTNVRAMSDGAGGATIAWNPAPEHAAGGDDATGYVVYRSSNGYGFCNPIVVDDRTILSVHVSDLAAGETTYFRVAATNAGGESLPSETVAVRSPRWGRAPILIVNGFDRIDRLMDVRETASWGIGGPNGGSQTYSRVKPRLMNSYDYVVRYAESIQASGRFFDSCANEAVIVGQVDLGDYEVAIWILGEETVGDETFSAVEQTKVAAFLDGGGRLMASGTEIGWDLDRPSGPTVADRDFYNSRLMADYVADDGGSYQAAGLAGTLLEEAAIGFAPYAADEIYDAETPDQMNAAGGSVLIANYSGGGAGGAALQYRGGSPERRLVVLGFPFECISPAPARDIVMGGILDFFYQGESAGGWMLH